MSLLVSLLVLSIVFGPTTIIVWKLSDKYCTTIKMEWPTTMKTDIASPTPKVCNDDVSYRYEWISSIVIIGRKDGAIDCSIDASYILSHHTIPKWKVPKELIYLFGCTLSVWYSFVFNNKWAQRRLMICIHWYCRPSYQSFLIYL